MLQPCTAALNGSTTYVRLFIIIVNYANKAAYMTRAFRSRVKSTKKRNNKRRTHAQSNYTNTKLIAWFRRLLCLPARKQSGPVLCPGPHGVLLLRYLVLDDIRQYWVISVLFGIFQKPWKSQNLSSWAFLANPGLIQ